MNPMSRRSIMLGGAALAGTTAVGLSHLFGALAQGSRDDKQTILNLTATAEALACAHYYAALTSTALVFDPTQTGSLKAAAVAELAHLDYLMRNGGKPIASEFYFPAGTFTNVNTFAQTTETIEKALLGVYLAVVRRLSELGDPTLAIIMAQIAGVEAQHLAVARQALGELPNYVAFAQTPYFNPTDATPTLKPFLDGGDGLEGPAAFPGFEPYTVVIADAVIELVPPGVTAADTHTPVVTPGAVGTEMTNATPAPAAPTCLVTAGLGRNVNVRNQPSTDSAVLGILPAGGTARVDGMRMDDAGFIWFHAAAGGWIRSDTVTAQPECAGLPQV